MAAAVAVASSLFALLFVRWRRGDKAALRASRAASPGMTRRPAMDTLEVRWPGVAAHAVRMLLRMPAPIRRRGLASAFDRAQDAFSRGDFRAVLALFTDRNLSVEETGKSRFVRTARLSHARVDSTLEYVIRQTTELRRGRVVRQVNEIV